MGGPDVHGPDLSILILSWNTKDLTLACLDALQQDETRHSREVLVLDNGSQDGSADAVEAFCEEHRGYRLLREEENLGYAIGNNRAAAEATGRYLCLLNSDTEVRPGALDLLVAFLESQLEKQREGQAGGWAVSPRLVHPDGRTQSACKRIPGLAVALVYDLPWARWPGFRRIDDAYYYRDFDHESSRCVEQPPGACFVIARDLWQELGGFDEELWLFYNDVDLCKRLADRGGRIQYLADAEVLHHEGASTRNFTKMVPVWARNRISYYRKHHGRLGAFIVRMMIRIRGWVEWWRLGARHRDPAEKRAARRELSRVLHEALGGKPQES